MLNSRNICAADKIPAVVFCPTSWRQRISGLHSATMGAGFQSVQRLGYEIDGRGFESWQEQEIFLLFRMSTLACGPPNLIFNV
jgi:hypothetical protein